MRTSQIPDTSRIGHICHICLIGPSPSHMARPVRPGIRHFQRLDEGHRLSTSTRVLVPNSRHNFCLDFVLFLRGNVRCFRIGSRLPCRELPGIFRNSRNFVRILLRFHWLPNLPGTRSFPGSDLVTGSRCLDPSIRANFPNRTPWRTH